VRLTERTKRENAVATEPLEQAIASTRVVLTGVSKDQLGDETPCADWKVSDLINHIVGGQLFFEAGANGAPPAQSETDFSSSDFVSAFDDGAKRCLAAFRADGVMEKTLTLPFGQMPGAAFMGLAATDTFTHGWDLAKATGQNTDLAPELAAQLLAGARQAIQPGFRNPEGNPFGAEQSAPASACNADQLAAFLGRNV
jgi:uncharacterized protein (TIGR03086 family)